MRKRALAVLLALAVTLSGCAIGREEVQAPARTVAVDGKLTIPVYQSHSGWVWLEEHKLAKYSAYVGAGVVSAAVDLVVMTIIAAATVVVPLAY